MMCDHRLWQHQIDTIEGNVVVPSMAGFDDIADLAGNILESAPPCFALAGLSMGGIVAFEIWRQAPHRVSHLALMGTSPYAETAEKQSIRQDQMEQVLAGGLRELAKDTLKPVYLAEANQDDDELLEVILDMAMDLGKEVFLQQSILLKHRPDSLETLTTISCPVSVICGREDVLCPVSLHETMSTLIPGARLQVLDNCGHLASMEQPEIVSQELKRLFAL